MHAGAGTVLLQQIALPTRKRPRAEGTGSSTQRYGGGGQGESLVATRLHYLRMSERPPGSRERWKARELDRNDGLVVRG